MLITLFSLCCNSRQKMSSSVSRNELSNIVILENRIGLFKGHIDSNGLKTGSWIQYNKDGIISFSSDYKKGLLNGHRVNYFESNGEIAAISLWVNDTIHGKSISYYSSGVMASSLSWKMGKFHGLQFYWTPCGTPQYRNEYLNGLRHGLQLEFNPVGDTIYKAIFNSGELLFDTTYSAHKSADGAFENCK